MTHDALCQRLRGVMIEDHNPAFGCAWCGKIAMIRADEILRLRSLADRAYQDGYERGRRDSETERRWGL